MRQVDKLGDKHEQLNQQVQIQGGSCMPEDHAQYRNQSTAKIYKTLNVALPICTEAAIANSIQSALQI